MNVDKPSRKGTLMSVSGLHVSTQTNTSKSIDNPFLNITMHSVVKSVLFFQ